MVRTSDGVMDINPLERMDQLNEITREKKGTIASKKKELEEFEAKKKREIEALEAQKKKEIEDLENRKKKELDGITQKKKELEDLEKKKAKEIEDTEDLIEQSFQDLMRHKRMIIAQEQEAEDKRHKEAPSLDYVAKTAAPPRGAPGIESQQSNYHKFFEELNAPRNVYEATNYNFYNGLTALRDRAARGEITPQEEAFIDNVRKQFEQFSSDTDIQRKDEHQYIQRSLNVVDQIWQYKKGYQGY